MYKDFNNMTKNTIFWFLLFLNRNKSLYGYSAFDLQAVTVYKSVKISKMRGSN